MNIPIGTGGPCYSSRGREPDAIYGSEVGLKKGKSEEIKVTAAMIDAGVTAFDEAKGAFADHLVVVRVYKAMRALEALSGHD
jgi:hypothetical protein